MQVRKNDILKMKKLKCKVSLPIKTTVADACCETLLPQKISIKMFEQNVPCHILVNVGDTVYVGTKIGEAEGVSPIYSSISGTVTAITTSQTPSGDTFETVTIESDKLMTADSSLTPQNTENRTDLINAFHNAGIKVDAGLNSDSEINTLIINGVQCDTYTNSDIRTCVENIENVLSGIKTIQKTLNIPYVVVCVDEQNYNTIYSLFKAQNSEGNNLSISMLKIDSSHPYGFDKMLVYCVTGQKLTPNQTPADTGCLILNFTEISKLNEYVSTGMPFVSRMISVGGDAVRTQKNVIAPFGTSIADLVEFCDGYKKAVRKIVLGGLMTGTSVPGDSSVTDKTTDTVLILDRKQTQKTTEKPCMHCGRCVWACPMNLRPFSIETAVNKGDLNLVSKLYADYCIECGNCSYFCPSKRRLTMTMQTAKSMLKSSQ